MRDTAPLIFVGPSLGAAEIRNILPNAIIVPPVARGDLYRYRMLNFGFFVILDGKFGDTLAVSPREVADVLQDGAVVLGAASMGALRAVDCGPAGAIGCGTVFRLFRKGVLTSEDDVAVLYLPEAQQLQMSTALVTIRVALRRARRSGAIDALQERALLGAAQARRYDQRSWEGLFQDADPPLCEATKQMLRSSDIKRQDAIACCNFVARNLGAGRLSGYPRKNFSAPIGKFGEIRERGRMRAQDMGLPDGTPDFDTWVQVAGQGLPLVDGVAAQRDDPVLVMRYRAFCAAVAGMRATVETAAPSYLALAENRILVHHGASDWGTLIRASGLAAEFATYRANLALALQWKARQFSRSHHPAG